MHMRALSFLFLWLTFTLPKVDAANCSTVFPDAASSSSSAGGISFNQFARLIGTDGVIDIPIIRDDTSNSCDTTSCMYSGNPARSLNLPGFNFSNSSQDITVSLNSSGTTPQGSYDNIFIEQNSTFHITGNSTVTRIDEIHIDDNSTLTLDNGVYWFNLLDMDSNAKLVIPTGQKVTLYLNTSNFEQNLRFNWDGTPDQLVLISYSDFSPSTNTFMRGYLYSAQDVIWDNFGKLVGAVNATNIAIGDVGEFTLDASSIETAMFDNTCTQDNELPTPILYYSMDMCSIPSAIPDQVGTNNGSVAGL
ncbi:hypothetical protein [Agaribacter flavus]|uniref:MSHA biogenesis protein MshQ n=1 Tax=Agaribacter flavus TaxID=1902781 RepID=A0ABV7FRQ3_9ALTE